MQYKAYKDKNMQAGVRMHLHCLLLAASYQQAYFKSIVTTRPQAGRKLFQQLI